jgi:hypothetical protein
MHPGHVTGAKRSTAVKHVLRQSGNDFAALSFYLIRGIETSGAPEENGATW